MKKNIWIMTIAVLAVFGIGFAASDDSSDSETNQPKENPYAPFVGQYELCDNKGRTGSSFFITEDGRVFGGKKGDVGGFYGSIDPISGNACYWRLERKFYVMNWSTSEELSSYEDEKESSLALRSADAHIPIYSITVIDISEKRLYKDYQKYKNRDYQSPSYYKFKFTKSNP